MERSDPNAPPSLSPPGAAGPDADARGRELVVALQGELQGEVTVLLLSAGAAARGSAGAFRDYEVSRTRVTTLLQVLANELPGLRRVTVKVERHLALVP